MVSNSTKQKSIQTLNTWLNKITYSEAKEVKSNILLQITMELLAVCVWSYPQQTITFQV